LLEDAIHNAAPENGKGTLRNHFSHGGSDHTPNRFPKMLVCTTARIGVLNNGAQQPTFLRTQYSLILQQCLGKRIKNLLRCHGRHSSLRRTDRVGEPALQGKQHRQYNFKARIAKKILAGRVKSEDCVADYRVTSADTMD
jgi:hypothetical protein